MMSTERKVWNRKRFGKEVSAEYLNDRRGLGGQQATGTQRKHRVQRWRLPDPRFCLCVELRNKIGKSTKHSAWYMIGAQ